MDNICLWLTMVHTTQNSLSPLQMTYPKTGPNICWQMSLFGGHVFVFCAADSKANIH